MSDTLEKLVLEAAKKTPNAPAVKGPDGALTYGQLDATANRLARALQSLGARQGDRVGLWLDKSCTAVAAMQACLRLGVAYVPLDPSAPVGRIGTIAENAKFAVVVCAPERVEGLAALPSKTLVLDGPPESLEAARDASPLPPLQASENDLAYILYTSGSTGVPKGVCLSHRNALAFVRWAADEVRATSADHFSNHAPFFFDLSVLDLYVAFLVGAQVAIVPEALAYSPRELVRFIEREAITVWYSVPSALMMMADQGGLLDAKPPSLRVVLFAGEPYPLKHLRALRAALPGPRYLNLYGPTETNVCTAHEVTSLSESRTEPVPIGKATCGDRVWMHEPKPRSDEDSTPVGELWVDGPTVMLGYWGQPPHVGPYNTGDLVRLDANGDYEYLGRRDHQVKVRGRRIELGDIEAALLGHPKVHEVVVLVRGEGLAGKLVAFVVPKVAGQAPGLLELKKHCAERLPRYMIVDEVRALESMPRTRNGKVDRRALP